MGLWAEAESEGRKKGQRRITIEAKGAKNEFRIWNSGTQEKDSGKGAKNSNGDDKAS
jgi:hypothetical protein